MKKMSVIRLTGRSIRSFFGRYMALLLIVALSVAFFSGLKVTKEFMWNTADRFLTEQQLYDYRLFSTLGFTSEDVERIAEKEFVDQAEGGKSVDALIIRGEKIAAYKMIALPQKVNMPSVTAGRLPRQQNECLADKARFTEEEIGSTIVISDTSGDGVREKLAGTEYTIVGLVDSPLYLGLDRGNTQIGSGALSGFIYLPEENFIGDIFTEISLTLKEKEPIYSSAYKEKIARYKGEIKELTEELAADRYQDLLAESGLPEELAASVGLLPGETYVLTRSENAGYVNFENDTSIVSGIANIFPLFFILIAMLVCITTMTRMVDEERTQIGTLKAMGYGNGTVTAKYLLYAGSATALGWVLGFFLGTGGLPRIFWYAYGTLYSFAPLIYQFSAPLAVGTFGAAMLGILGSAWLSCRKELTDVPAGLIRPKGVKKGKRILLERVTPLWKKLPFLTKVTLRNMFRYKKRFIMMLVGIGCCAGLVVTAFGIRDSMIAVGSWQFEDIQSYGLEATLMPGKTETVFKKLDETEGVKDYIGCRSENVELQGGATVNSVMLYSFEDEDKVREYWHFRSGEETLSFPQKGEALISSQAAQKLSLSVGDDLVLEDRDKNSMSVVVSGIFDNYVEHYVIVASDTCREAWGENEINTVLIHTEQKEEELAEQLTKMEEITGVTRLSVIQERVDSALSCLNYIIWLVVGFSGALAFIVIFNLTNINLAERSREIATVEVLGFYPRETQSYVLHENLLLSALASLIGLPLGTLFHRIVMSMINIDMIAFNIHITTASYVLSVICTMLFAIIVNIFMKRQIGRIKMAESLKAVE